MLFSLRLGTLFWTIVAYQTSKHYILGSDILTPYQHQHGSRLNHRTIRDCQGYRNEPHETYPAHISDNISVPFVKVKRFLKILSSGITENVIRGHYAVVSDPLRTISVLEPSRKDGCHLNLRETVLETAKQKKCEVAINAGYFDTKLGTCLGNVISDGRLVKNSGDIQNAHFGLMKNKSLFTGYVSETQVKDENSFLQLIGGVIWILRNSIPYVNVSKDFECEDTEETGPMNKFLEVLSSRTAIGHDSDGRVVIVQVDGKTDHSGISLLDMQDLLKKMGLVNAINLDGGGSSTFVVNGTVVNYPSDECSSSGVFVCERKVSTVICIHPPDCEPPDCNGHGECNMGVCTCHNYWLPPHCDQLTCKNNCSGHGLCTEQGCHCNSEFSGDDCKDIFESFTDIINVKEDLMEKDRKRKIQYYVTMVSVIIAISIIFGLVFICYSYTCTCQCKGKRRFCRKRKQHRYRDLQSLTTLSDSSESDSSPMNVLSRK